MLVAKSSTPVRKAVGASLVVLGLLLILAYFGLQWYVDLRASQMEAKIAADRAALQAQRPPLSVTSASKVALPAEDLQISRPTAALPLPDRVLERQAPEPAPYIPPTRLVIPKIKLDSKIVEVGLTTVVINGVRQATWQVADYAVGHHEGSGVPGRPGNIVLSGHVDIRGEVFRDLDKLSIGDTFTLYSDAGQFQYMVTDIKLVREVGVPREVQLANAAFMNPTVDETVTMITCWPYGIDTHRLIVIGKRADRVGQ
jgi:sortase A